MSHITFTLLTAVLLSVAMAMLGHRGLRKRLYSAMYLFLCCAVTAVTGSWG